MSPRLTQTWMTWFATPAFIPGPRSRMGSDASWTGTDNITEYEESVARARYPDTADGQLENLASRGAHGFAFLRCQAGFDGEGTRGCPSLRPGGRAGRLLNRFYASFLLRNPGCNLVQRRPDTHLYPGERPGKSGGGSASVLERHGLEFR